MIIAGHVLALRLPFANGNLCKTKRPFLVLKNENNNLELLNISSTKGKERKLLYSSNVKINNYYPPLDYPSFLKLDELYIISHFDDLKNSVYKGRDPIITNEFNRLYHEFCVYEQNYIVSKIKQFETSVRQDNKI